MPMYACQLWSKCTKTSMKRVRAAYNNTCRIMHHIQRNVSVRPHQVSHCVRTFDALLRNNFVSIFYTMRQGCGALCFRKHGSGSGAVFFMTWLRLCFVNTLYSNNFGIPSVLLVASERVIATYFELRLLPLPGLGSRKEFGLE